MKSRELFRRLMTVLLAGVLCMGAVVALPTMADDSRTGGRVPTEDDPLVAVKDVYVEGEPILIKALGAGKDWVGIYLPTDVVGVHSSVSWLYVEEEGFKAGDERDMRTAKFPPDRGAYQHFPAGEYVLYLLANDGYEILATKTIRVITADEAADMTEPETELLPEAWAPTEAEPLRTNKTVYTEGEDVLVRALGTGTDWVGLYCEGETPPNGTPPSIYWFYVEENGHASGDIVNIKAERFSTDRSEYEGIPAGEYRLVLCVNDGYEVKAEVSITVKAAPSNRPTTPTSAVFAGANAGKGRADGTLTVKHDGNAPKAYVLRWADAKGPLKDYTDIATVACSGETTTYTMTPHTLIPVGADRILVYAQKSGELSEPAVAMLPPGAGDYDLGRAYRELQVMSDIHLNTDTSHPYNRQFTAALREIKKLSPDTSGVFINGDIADLGLAANYEAYRHILESTGKGLDVYAAIGNHDFYGPKYGGPEMTDAEKIAQFLRGTNNDSETVYFDKWIDGVHYIFLGSEAYVPPNAQLSDTQLDWLKDTLEKDRAAGMPVFLFLHEGIMDTVAGTFGYQGWHGVEQGEKLKAIIDAHPEVILFSGHSHWVLESPVTFLPGEGKAATHVSTASCAYLWDDNANKTNVGIDGSQGYYIYLYDDCIVLRGRSFSEGKWIASAQFVMDWDFAGAWDSETEPADTTPDEPATDTAPVDTAQSETTVSPAGSEPETPADATLPGSDADSASETSEPAGKGCASALLPGVLLSLLCAAAFVIRRRRG